MVYTWLVMVWMNKYNLRYVDVIIYPCPNTKALDVPQKDEFTRYSIKHSMY